ncbi:hypothetical protein JR316_0000096 [Psilocybe cubensis]|uniref:Uncharacterized protein n=1 Tax=Psilocybe cubensis TaxID=181762 RepID=A0ACB8HEA2_PSICU|nr:hypothetical protein JR316_0000096 [Psilocybe cubensis]KAH9486032.1 hypothetical protein JR316_0000096 [Psilocybe cubensis]
MPPFCVDGFLRVDYSLSVSISIIRTYYSANRRCERFLDGTIQAKDRMISQSTKDSGKRSLSSPLTAGLEAMNLEARIVYVIEEDDMSKNG